MAWPQDGGGWDAWLGDDARARLERQLLPAFLPSRRWFAGKARTLDAVRLLDATVPGALPGTTLLALFEAAFRDGPADTYLLPLALASGAEAERLAREHSERIIARADGGEVLYDALADGDACAALLAAIEQGREITTGLGRVRASSTTAYAEARGPADVALHVRHGTAEQSNSALIYGDRLILKVFRRLEPGLNPDLEIGRFLSDRTGFDRIPKTAGALEYDRRDDEPVTLAILQGLVRNQGTGWEHALDELRGYYERIAHRGDAAPIIPAAASPVELASSDDAIPPQAAEAIGGYLDAADTLGRRTAELHLALASDPDDPAFAPEPMTAADLSALADDTRAQVAAALAALRDGIGTLAEPAASQGRRALDGAPGLLAILDRLPALEMGATKIRVHGDYHLGQVLRVEADFVILDFEGEPARPLAKRREKQSPLKDVVGMLRSFDYAAFAGLFAFAADRPGEAERLAPWARLWQAGASAAFLRRYLATAAGAKFLPAERAHLGLLLGVYTLDKALYELLYELNNRPGWVRIPLQGVLTLVEQGDAAVQKGQIT
jgi:maltose alpha-D-glucosyltransferase / alpha-amylase